MLSILLKILIASDQELGLANTTNTNFVTKKKKKLITVEQVKNLFKLIQLYEFIFSLRFGKINVSG